MPHIKYQGQSYQAEFALLNLTQLQLISAKPRTTEPVYGTSIIVDDNLDFTLQPINFDGQLYSAKISYQHGDRFSIDDILILKQDVKGRGDLIDSNLVNQISPSQFKFLLGLYNLRSISQVEIEAKYAVQVYSVKYQTIDPSGTLVVASALIAFPDDTEHSFPLIAYQHESMVLKENAPSQNTFDLPSVALAASGYVVVSADYLGLGDSPLLHPFIHAHSLATSVIDALRTARQLSAEYSIKLNGQLFLAGYSEGGYATMAVHRELQRNYSEEFKVTASAPMAGPYALSDTFQQAILVDQAVTSPYHVPYTLLAYNQIYTYMDQLSEFFLFPYDQTIFELYDGLHTAEEINDVLPDKQQLYTQAFYDALEGKQFRLLKVILYENDVYRWQPDSPMYLYHCLKDNKVAYQNSQIAYDYFQSVGANQVQLLTLDDPLLHFEDIHTNCAIPLLLQGKARFDAMRE